MNADECTLFTHVTFWIILTDFGLIRQISKAALPQSRAQDVDVRIARDRSGRRPGAESGPSARFNSGSIVGRMYAGDMAHPGRSALDSVLKQFERFGQITIH